MNRRLFFAALAGLPFVGKLVPKEYDAADFFDPGNTKGAKFSDLPTVEWTADSAAVMLDCPGPGAPTFAPPAAGTWYRWSNDPEWRQAPFLK